MLWGKAKNKVVDKALSLLSRASILDDTALASKVDRLIEAKAPSLSERQLNHLNQIRDSFTRNGIIEEDDKLFGDDDGPLEFGHLSFGDDKLRPKLEFTPFEPSAIDEIQSLCEQENYTEALSAFAGKIVDYSTKTISPEMLDELAIAEGIHQEDLLESFSELLAEVIESVPHPLVSLESYQSMAQSAQTDVSGK